jgi:hypothetical protein
MLVSLLAVGLFTRHLFLVPILAWLGLVFFALSLALVSAKLLKIDIHVPKSAVLLLVMLAVEPNAYASIKPLLNLAPFTADPLLAGIDHAIFGADPWRFLQWLRPLFGYYFLGWLGAICLAALHLALAPPSPHKDRVIVLYFLLWTIAAPVFHLLFPAGGPVFYELLGFGDRFALLPVAGEVLSSRNYLWMVHQAGFSGQYAGISAMPSLHVAIATWVALVFWRSALFPVAVFHAVLIFLLSIATGWHYAVDGLVSIALVLGIYAALSFTPRRGPIVEAGPAASELGAC